MSLVQRKVRRAATIVGTSVVWGSVVGGLYGLFLAVPVTMMKGGDVMDIAHLTLMLGLLAGACTGLFFSPIPLRALFRVPLAAAGKPVLLSAIIGSIIGAFVMCVVAVATTLGTDGGVTPATPFFLLGIWGFPVLGFLKGIDHAQRVLPASWTPHPTRCCAHCGYDRTGLVPDALCPECGSAIGPGANR